MAVPGQWMFSVSGGDSDGFNEGAIDIFKGLGVQSMVREVIQNSADAHNLGRSPTEIAFSLFDVPSGGATEIVQLKPWLQRAWDAEPPNSNAESSNELRHDFYKGAMASLDAPLVQFLGIHDFNTSGLRGPTSFGGEEELGAWWALVRSTGRNKKAHSGAAGSFGHGSKAPFAFSRLRSVFYYTHFVEDGIYVERFQGKSILESMTHPTNAKRFTSNTGYFASSHSDEDPQPLPAEALPPWAKENRLQFGDGPGTSVFIPLPQLSSDDKFWSDVKIAVAANFAAAVSRNQIIVRLGKDVVINSATIVDVFQEINRAGLDDIPKERLESTETILLGQHGSETWEGIGEVEYFYRQGDNISTRRVGIARSLGMLITRNAERLSSRARFGATSPFDLFLWVRGQEGNRLLRGLENPSHDAFEFDRIADTAKQKEVRGQYEALVLRVRGLIDDLFAITVEKRVPLNDLDFLLSSNSLGEDTEDVEGGDSAPTISLVLRPVSPSGGKKNRTKKVGKPVPKGRKPPRGRSGALEGSGSQVERNEVLIEEFRVVPSSTNNRMATLYFKAPVAEYRNLEVYRTGGSEISPVACHISTSMTLIGATHVPLPDGDRKKRMKMEIIFANEADLHGSARLLGVAR